MKDEIDNILDSIIEAEDTDIEVKNNTEVDASDTDELANEVLRQTIDDRKKADNIFELLEPGIGLGTDKTGASKEALTKALELKIAASRNIIELLKIRKGLVEGNKMGIIFNQVPKAKAGINLDNIKREL